VKSLWHLETLNTRLTASNLDRCFYTNVVQTFLDGSATNQLTGSPAQWPNAVHTAKSDVITDRWSWGSGPSRRESTLTTQGATVVPVNEPILTLGNFEVHLGATYANPVWRLDYQGQVVRVTNETVRLTPPLSVDAASLLQTRTAVGTNGATVHTRFYWPKPPTGVVAGYTAPLVTFVETRIDGVTPIRWCWLIISPKPTGPATTISPKNSCLSPDWIRMCHRPNGRN